MSRTTEQASTTSWTVFPLPLYMRRALEYINSCAYDVMYGFMMISLEACRIPPSLKPLPSEMGRGWEVMEACVSLPRQHVLGVGWDSATSE